MNECLRCPAPLDGLAVHIAVTRQELVAAYELVYRRYREKAYIKPHRGMIVYHPAFAMPSSRTLVALAKPGRVVGTLSVVGDSPIGLQLDKTFPREMSSLRRRGRKVCELTCLAIASADRCGPSPVFFNLTKFTIHYALNQRYDDLLMAVHPRHYRFYWRQYRTYLEGSCRPYEPANGNPAVFCRIDLRHLERNMAETMRQYYFTDPPPVGEFSRPPLRPEDHRYFSLRSGLAEEDGSEGCAKREQSAA